MTKLVLQAKNLKWYTILANPVYEKHNSKHYSHLL